MHIYTPRWFASLFVALWALPLALATGHAGAYERLGPIFETYRIAVIMWGPKQRRILPGLGEVIIPGIADLSDDDSKLRAANFLEMFNYLDDKAYTAADFEDAEIGDLDKPDMAKTAIFMDYEEAAGLLSLEKVFVGADTDFPAVLERVRTLVTEAMNEAPTAGKWNDIEPHLTRLQQAHQQIIVFRQSDMEGGNNGKKGMAKDIKTRWPAAKPKVITNYWSYDNSIRLFSFDPQGTVDQSPGVFDVNEVNTYVKEYGSEAQADATGQARNHWKVLNEHNINNKIVDTKLKSMASGSGC